MITFIGTVERNEEVAEIANRIVKAIGLDYNINMQLKYSADGIPKIIEIRKSQALSYYALVLV